MTKGKKIGIAVIAIVLVLVITYIILRIPVNPERFTEEQHIERITKLVKKRYFDKNSKYDLTGFEVFPMYDESDRFTHCIVEFQPYGFLYVRIEEYIPISQIFWGSGMYLTDASLFKSPKNHIWQRYRICEEGKDPNPFQGIVWQAKEGEWHSKVWYPEDPKKRYEVDENGEFVEHNVSPFQVAGVENEKRYMLGETEGNRRECIPAVKRGNKFLNLISMEEITYVGGMDVSQFATIKIAIYPGSSFNL